MKCTKSGGDEAVFGPKILFAPSARVIYEPQTILK
jgi:hypothetical protein